jgi:CheY-like chemotaxis protein
MHAKPMPRVTLSPTAARVAAPGSDDPRAEPSTSPSVTSQARDLKDLLAVIIGVCEALAEKLSVSPEHSELARVGALAADRVADLLTDFEAKAKTFDAGPPGGLPRKADGGARKVLLVEDDPDLLSLLTAAFAREGYQTFTARNGRLGVQMLQTLQPDLMVTDIVMPEMEGIGAIMEARRSARETRVIAISGGGHYGRSQSFLEWARELGADEVLAKPFRMSSLITAARVVLDRPAAELRPQWPPAADLAHSG